jgi:hypothetical protein
LLGHLTGQEQYSSSSMEIRPFKCNDKSFFVLFFTQCMPTVTAIKGTAHSYIEYCIVGKGIIIIIIIIIIIWGVLIFVLLHTSV